MNVRAFHRFRASERDFDLEVALEQASCTVTFRVCDAHRASDLAKNLARLRDASRVSASDLDLARGIVLDLESAIDSDLEATRRLLRGLDLDRVRVRARARDVIPVLERALVRARGLVLELERFLILDFVRAVAVAEELAEDLATARAPASRLVAVIEMGARRPQGSGVAKVVAPLAMAARIVHSAVRVLPAGSQARYDAEFGSELYELAAARASWWAQLGYGLRLIDRAWVLRAELREAAVRRVRS
jgi:hypothetical protein